MQPKYIPAEIPRSDLLAAMAPLLARLGVTANEIADDVHIADGRVVFTLVARADDDDTAERLAGLQVGDFPEGDAREFTEFSSRIVVKVADV